MWKAEVHQKGLLKASLKYVVWKFIRTRVLFDMFLYLVSLSLGFLGPVSMCLVPIEESSSL